MINIVITNYDTLAIISRISFKYGLKDIFNWVEKEMDNHVEIIKYCEENNLEFKFRKENREKISELKQEVDSDWARGRRMEFLGDRLKELAGVLGKKDEFGFLINPGAEKKYKSFYVEYATLRGNLEDNNSKIDEDTIERCREVDIRELISDQVINTGNGRCKIKCPFHEEKDASCTIYPPGRGFHCFGCGKSGSNTIDFIMAHRDIDFVKAVEYLKSYI